MGDERHGKTTAAQAARGRTNDPDRTKADILDVAADHFATSGLSGARVDDIAEQTHTSKRMLYYYFGSKEGLYRAVLARAYDRIRAHEAEIDLEAMKPADALRRLVEITFDHHRRNVDFVRLVMVENIHRGAHVAEVVGIEKRATSVIGIIDRLLERGQADGSFRSDVTALDLHLTISSLAFFNVSNRHTIERIFHHDMADEAVALRRRDMCGDIVLRWVCA